MAGGGSSELQVLKDRIDGMIAEMEARIEALEKNVGVEPRPGGGTSGGKKKAAGGKKK